MCVAHSYETIFTTGYRRKGNEMLKYSPTLSSAQAYAAGDKIDEWIHLFLRTDGRNLPFSDGLRLFERTYFSPAKMPLNLFRRCTGPGPEMKYRIGKEQFELHVAKLEKAIGEGADLPPLIVHYVDGDFELNDGNHRHKAYENLGIREAWTIVWITEEAEVREFSEKYGEYVKNCTVIRR